LTPSTTRFNVLSSFSCVAVLDRETGLVWEQTPDSTAFTWAAALDHCTMLLDGGKLGWRLPTDEELGS
jgi:hypothetical protein